MKFPTHLLAFLVLLLLLCCEVSCGGGAGDPDTTAINYREAAEREYARLLEVWYYQGDLHTFMWYQGNALDTLIDYVSITQDQDKGSELARRIDALWQLAKPEGNWWDDFGWWGIAFLNAARNHRILGQNGPTQYLDQARDTLEHHMDYATRVWAYALTSPCLHEHPEDWYMYQPRFDGGVWNCAFAGKTPGPQQACNPNTDGQQIFPPPPPTIPVGTPGDYCSQLNPLQNTVTNGLYLVLNARYYMQDPRARETRHDQTVAIYRWFKSWMDIEDEEITLCFGNQTRPSLLNSETGLVRERVGTYALDSTISPPCFRGAKWYEPDLSWAGDQGIVLGGLVDMLNSKLTEDRTWLLDRAKGILDGVKDHMTRGMTGSTRDNLAPGVLRPWTKFDGWGPDDIPKTTFGPPGGFGFGDPGYPQPGDPEYDALSSCGGGFTAPLDASTNYIAGPGIFMRYLLYAYRNSRYLRHYIRSHGYLAFLRANADAIAEGSYSCSCKNAIDSGTTCDACTLSCQINRLATLNAAISILAPRAASNSTIPFTDFYDDTETSDALAQGCSALLGHTGLRGIQVAKGSRLRAYNIDFSTGGTPKRIEVSGFTPYASGPVPSGRLELYLNDEKVGEIPLRDIRNGDVLSGDIAWPASLTLGSNMELDIRVEDARDAAWKLVLTGVRFRYE